MIVVVVGCIALVWALFVAALMVAGRRSDALALARFIPDSIVLFKRLLADRRVKRRHKLFLALTVGYLALPLDLVPDFIPVAGQLDDVLLVAIALRMVVRSAGVRVFAELWPGPRESLRALQRLI